MDGDDPIASCRIDGFDHEWKGQLFGKHPIPRKARIGKNLSRYSPNVFSHRFPLQIFISQRFDEAKGTSRNSKIVGLNRVSAA